MIDKLLNILEQTLDSNCIKYKGGLLFIGNSGRVNTIYPYELKEGDDKSKKMIRVSVNFRKCILPKAVSEAVLRLKPLNDLDTVEVTLLPYESEIIGVWLAMVALGVEPADPDDLLCWPSGDYAWTLAAARVGLPDGYSEDGE